VSLRLEAASLCAVIGPSGAGKTSLLRIIAGLLEHEGTVRIDGADVTGVPTHRRGVAMLFQEPRLFDSMTVLDNVAYAERVRRAPRHSRRAQAARLLEEVGLSGRGDDRPVDLSGGERQRIALARALNATPKVLLLDEPLSALDAARRSELRSLIDTTRRVRQLTTVLVSHDVADAVALADRIAVVADGQVVQIDTPARVLERPASPTVARITGNPNALVDGSKQFTIRPEHVVIGDDGTPVQVTTVERRLSHDVVAVTSPWGLLHAFTPAGVAPPVGSVLRVTLPAGACWIFPTPVHPVERTGDRP
jgi:putative spermidine/putrescine transport system ATP-binding protein